MTAHNGTADTGNTSDANDHEFVPRGDGVSNCKVCHGEQNDHKTEAQAEIQELKRQLAEANATLKIAVEVEKHRKELIATVSRISQLNGKLVEVLEAFATAFAEPETGTYFKLRAVAESYGIYADDLGRDRILLRIARAALAEATKP